MNELELRLARLRDLRKRVESDPADRTAYAAVDRTEAGLAGERRVQLVEDLCYCERLLENEIAILRKAAEQTRQ